MAMKWHNRQDVRMFSTLHSDEIVNTGKHQRASGNACRKKNLI
jgi:surface antigen